MASTSPDPRLMGPLDEPPAATRYRKMRFIRRFEQTLLELFEQGVLNGTTHCSIGQEADAVAITEPLRRGDHVFSNHRCHGHFLARTGDAKGLLAELMGKQAGLCRGVGGSQHIAADGFKSNGVQGGIVPAAAGIAWANQLRGTDDVSVVFLGDGTLGEGVVYETMNIAALWRLPLWVVVEDNAWAQSTPLFASFAGSMSARFEAFGLPVRELDTTDVEVIAGAAQEELQILRHTGAPRVLIVHTYRLCHHSKSDDQRPEAEVAARWRLDPLLVHADRVDEATRGRIHAEVEAALGEVVAEVRAAP